MAKKFCKLTFLLFFITITICTGQKDPQNVSAIDLTTMSQINQGNSYITFPTDIGNIASLWFEGNVVPNFFIRKNKTARLMAVLTPQIILRMYQKESFPVQPPSYIPQISFYYSTSKNPYLKALRHLDGWLTIPMGNRGISFWTMVQLICCREVSPPIILN